MLFEYRLFQSMPVVPRENCKVSLNKKKELLFFTKHAKKSLQLFQY